MSERASTKGPLAVHHQSTPCTIAGFYHVTEVGKDRPAVAYVHSRDDALLYAAAPDMFEALKAYEAWEADVIMTADWSGETPRLTQEQWDRLIEIQTMRNSAIANAEGLGQRADATPTNPLSEGGERS